MQQLSGLDTAFLSLETAAAPLHVGSVSLLSATAEDGSPVGYQQIVETVAARLHLLPPFRWKLATVPLGLDHPYWVDDPDFDLEFHLRENALPAPGTDAQLAELVSRIHARRLDRSRPLWETHVISGLASGELAVYTKMHHAAIDGVSGAEILTVLLDLVPTPAGEVPTGGPGVDQVPVPRRRVVLAKAGLNLARLPQRVAGTAVRTAGALPYLGGMVRGVVPGLRGEGVLSRPRLQAPPTPFNATLTAHRRFAFGSLPLSEIKAVKNAAGVTVNDVVMALCAGAVRRYLLEVDALPESPLQAMVPISVRGAAGAPTVGNQVTAMVSMLATHLPTAAERLAASHESMTAAKSHNAVPATLLQDYSAFATPAVGALAARTVARLRWADRVRSPVNLVISNIPGPPVPLFFAGARLRALFPVSAIADGVGLNITVQSYLDSLDIGIVACRETTEDLWSMVGHLRAELDELLTATGAAG